MSSASCGAAPASSIKGPAAVVSGASRGACRGGERRSGGSGPKAAARGAASVSVPASAPGPSPRRGAMAKRLLAAPARSKAGGDGEGEPFQEERIEKRKWQSLRFVRTVLFFNPVRPFRAVKGLVGRVFGRAKGRGKGEGEAGATIQVFGEAGAQGAVGPCYLVAGATGGVGKRCVGKLLRRGLRVRALVRDVDKARAMFAGVLAELDAGAASRLELVPADITQPATLLPEMFAGVRAVVCCTACKVQPKEGDNEARDKYYQGIKFFDPEIVGDTPEVVDFMGVKNLVDAFKQGLASPPSSSATMAPAPAVNLLAAGEGGAAALGATPSWGSLDDVVMGGVSESAMATFGEQEVAGERCSVFRGVVRTENNGGFASLRTKNMEPALNLSRFAGLRLRVVGNGLRYKFLIRTEKGFDVVGYSLSFDTKKGSGARAWEEVVLPFAAFQPVFRAKTLSVAKGEAPPLDPSKVVSMQIMLSKFEYDGALNPSFQPGAFELPIASLSPYTAAEDTGDSATSNSGGCQFVYVSSAGVTRPDRPGIDVEAEPPAVKLNEALGGILTYKLRGEDAVRASGLSHCVVRPCALTEEPEGAPLAVGQGDTIKGKISREDVAELCARLALGECGAMAGTTFEIKSEVPFSEPFESPDGWQGRPVEDWAALLRGIRPGVTGKTVNGVYTGARPEAEAAAAEAAAEEPGRDKSDAWYAW